jgi:hypothetical protein
MSCVVVLGLYRSGSSAVAGVLHHLGVYMGSHFDPPNANNIYGYWEDLEFKKLHKEMLEGKDVEEKYCELIEKREEKPIWGVKDPLLCLLLPNLINNLNTSYCLIHVVRKDEDVKASLAKAGVPTTWEQIQLLEEKKQEMLSIPGQRVLEVKFERLMEFPKEAVSNIAHFIDRYITDKAVNFIRKPS